MRCLAYMLCDLFAGWHIHRHVTYKISISTPRRSRGWEVEGDHGEWVKQLRDDQGSLQGAVIQWRTKKGSCNISWNLPFSCPGMFTQLHNREFRIECSRFLYISNACMYIIKVYRNHFQTRTNSIFRSNPILPADYLFASHRYGPVRHCPPPVHLTTGTGRIAAQGSSRSCHRGSSRGTGGGNAVGSNMASPTVGEWFILKLH